MDGGSLDATVQSLLTFSNVSNVESTGEGLKFRKWETYLQTGQSQLHLSLMLEWIVSDRFMLRMDVKSSRDMD